MVFNGVTSGLSNALWATQFYLPTVRTTLRATEEGTYMADKNIGEMFFNFMSRKDFRPYYGVSISKYRK